MKSMNQFYKILGWWEEQTAKDRFVLKYKYGIKEFSNDEIKRVHKLEHKI